MSSSLASRSLSSSILCVCMYLDVRIKTCIDSGCDKVCVCVCVCVCRRTEEMVCGMETLCKVVRGESDCYIVCS